MDPNNRLNDLIVITGRLAELLQRENAALRSHRAQEVRDLLDEKATLSRVYETRYKGIAEHPEIIEGADLDVRDRLRIAGEKVQVLMEENARLLKIAISANKRVVELIAEAVREQQPSAGVYGASGRASTAGSTAASQRLAYSLDQNL
ncbi:MAG: hypothetical protein VW405_08370 [Rhodospirillaceae bacterium]